MTMIDTTVNSDEFRSKSGNEPGLAEQLLRRLDQFEKKLDWLKKKRDPDRLLTKEGVAERLNVSERTVDTLAASGEIQKIKVRGCVRFAPQAVDAYIRRVAGEGPLP